MESQFRNWSIIGNIVKQHKLLLRFLLNTLSRSGSSRCRQMFNRDDVLLNFTRKILYFCIGWHFLESPLCCYASTNAFCLNFHQSFIIWSLFILESTNFERLLNFAVAVPSPWTLLVCAYFVLATKVRVDTDTTDHTLIFAAQNFVMESPNYSVAPLQTIFQLSGVFDYVIYYFLLQFFNF